MSINVGPIGLQFDADIERTAEMSTAALLPAVDYATEQLELRYPSETCASSVTGNVNLLASSALADVGAGRPAGRA